MKREGNGQKVRLRAARENKVNKQPLKGLPKKKRGRRTIRDLLGAACIMSFWGLRKLPAMICRALVSQSVRALSAIARTGISAGRAQGSSRGR